MPTEEMQRAFISRVPLGTAGEHGELADLAAYLVSDGSSYVTGALFYIDGGESVYNAGEFNLLSALSDADWDELAKDRR